MEHYSLEYNREIGIFAPEFEIGIFLRKTGTFMPNGMRAEISIFKQGKGVTLLFMWSW